MAPGDDKPATTRPFPAGEMPTITLITGANQGIGFATATVLAKVHKHHVIIGSRNAEAGAEAAALLRAEGGSVSCIQLDLTSDASIEAAVDTSSGHCCQV